LTAQEEFKEHKLQEYVSVYHKNVCKDGFTDQVTDIDAGNNLFLKYLVFLDLPSPWEALPFLKVNFRKNSAVKIATFSPCIEQVFKTLAVLKEGGYKDIKMFEILQKPLNVFPMSEWKSLPGNTEITEKTRETRENVETKKRKVQEQEGKSLTSQCAQSIKGHTSYLVFATFLNN
jgi:tRNA (adenine57-N1/adenine58-N1)-methyltransferase